MVDYYENLRVFDKEFEHGIMKFFDVKNKNELYNLKVDEQTEGWLNEWLWFDFRYSNGMTMLEDFVATDPLNLSEAELGEYKELLAENVYGFFEIMRVDLNQGLRLKNISTGKEYEIKERAATRGAEVGSIITGRIGKINGHYELVGANGVQIHIKMGNNLKKILLKDKTKYTPKITFQIISRGSTAEGVPETVAAMASRDLPLFDHPALSRVAVERNFTAMLHKYHLDSFISLETVKEWIANSGEKISDLTYLTMLTGLARETIRKEEQEEIIRIANALQGVTPQKRLNGKSPLDLVRDDPDRQPDLVHDITPIFSTRWANFSIKAEAQLRAGDFEKSMRNFGSCFKSLLEDKTTFSEIYRVYANKAIAHFAAGEKIIGEKMLQISITLNRNYEFCQNLQVKLANGEFDVKDYEKKFKKIDEKKLTKDAAVLYYEFLLPFKINFTTPTLTKSKLTNFRWSN